MAEEEKEKEKILENPIINKQPCLICFYEEELLDCGERAYWESGHSP